MAPLISSLVSILPSSLGAEWSIDAIEFQRRPTGCAFHAELLRFVCLSSRARLGRAEQAKPNGAVLGLSRDHLGAN